MNKTILGILIVMIAGGSFILGRVSVELEDKGSEAKINEVTLVKPTEEQVDSQGTAEISSESCGNGDGGGTCENDVKSNTAQPETSEQVATSDKVDHQKKADELAALIEDIHDQKDEDWNHFVSDFEKEEIDFTWSVAKENALDANFTTEDGTQTLLDNKLTFLETLCKSKTCRLKFNLLDPEIAGHRQDRMLVLAMLAGQNGATKGMDGIVERTADDELTFWYQTED
ncbi:MAG: hypothetical protein V2I33_08360 [Kangiellaceae bacterium]|jgi:hypothetical protein|nr:hypothetical protein [Kangiellaceae bacterium]